MEVNLFIVPNDEEPRWVTLNQGKEIKQEANADPSIILARTKFDSVDFEGTLFIDPQEGDDDYVGFVFSYQVSGLF